MLSLKISISPLENSDNKNGNLADNNLYNPLPEIICVSTYPPRECGIATFSRDLIDALNNKFYGSFKITVCALESSTEKHLYTDEVKYILNTDDSLSFNSLAKEINNNENIKIVLFQHEFGLFSNNERKFVELLIKINKPILIVFHTILPNPSKELSAKVKKIASLAQGIIVMTNTSAEILDQQYKISHQKITVIPHGTHLVSHINKSTLKAKYGLENRKVLSTFGLLSSGKSLETTLEALPAIIKKEPSVLFLIIGKTHPSIIKNEGEIYREMLKSRVAELGIEHHVKFINQFLPLPSLLEYLQLTDTYLFTSKDPHQAVSGTFSYAISSGCPIISTPIPHAKEVLQNDTGIIIDFNNSTQLSEAVISVLGNDAKREQMILNGVHRIAPTAWENVALAYARLFKKTVITPLQLSYNIPPININHLQAMTTEFGMIQFSKLNTPDINSGYTLDDNSRALIAMCQYYEITKDSDALLQIRIYLTFIQYCQQNTGELLNYVNEKKEFTDQNTETNLEDSNGRAIWALGYFISLKELLPESWVNEATSILTKYIPNIDKIYSTRAMAFIIKGLYYFTLQENKNNAKELIIVLGDRLVQMYKHETSSNWQWFEGYLTYGNSVLSEALLCAWLATGKDEYKDIAKSSFDFILSKTFNNKKLIAISNKNWLLRGNEDVQYPSGGEQPIEIAYTIMALEKFITVFASEEYLDKLQIAFNWFLGNNHLQQIIYNPCTGGCYDGLEETCVNLNQGAESTLSYLMARLLLEKRASVLKKEKVGIKYVISHTAAIA